MTQISNSPDTKERLVIGEYTLTRCQNGKDYWLDHESGEGMQVFKKALEDFVAELWKEF